jgi:hypothetical protein
LEPSGARKEVRQGSGSAEVEALRVVDTALLDEAGRVAIGDELCDGLPAQGLSDAHDGSHDELVHGVCRDAP